MLGSGKFLYGCFGFGAMAFMATALLQVPAAHPNAGMRGISSVANSDGSGAAAQVTSLCNDIAAQVGPQIKYATDVTGAFVSKNATTARLQFEGMTNAVMAHMDAGAWVPDSAPAWMRGGAAVAAQATTSEAVQLSQKLPVVKAVKSSLSRLSDVHPSFSF
jgi:hypothetical protein